MVKVALVQALRLCTGRTAHRSRGIALLFDDHGASHSLPPGKTQYPLYRRLGGPQDRYGQVRKISPPPGFDPRTVQPVASRYTDRATRPTIPVFKATNIAAFPVLATCKDAVSTLLPLAALQTFLSTIYGHD
jgi:hypothetical protein